MKKFSASFLIFIFSIVTFLFILPASNTTFAQTIGTVCGDASSGPNGPCDPGLTCIDPDGEGTRFECGAPSTLRLGAECKVAETACIGDAVCSPDAPGSATGKCTALGEGIACDPSNKQSCGPSVTAPLKCKPDTTNGGNTCQATECDPAKGSIECDPQHNFYCVEGIDGTSKCQFSTNPPDPPKGPLPPCAYYKDDVCKSFNTAFGNISTDAGGFIKAGFGLILGASGAVALLLIIRAGYKIMTSQGKPETVQEGKDQLVAAIVGLVFLIFAFVFLEVIGVDLLRIPGLEGINGTPNNLKKGAECIIGEQKCNGKMACFNKPDSKKGEKGTCQGNP